jgi:hypothetical protein
MYDKIILPNDKIYIINDNIESLKYIYSFVYDKFAGLIRYYFHIEAIHRSYQEKLLNIRNFIDLLSVKFIRNKITQDEFEINIKKSYKKIEIYNEKILLIRTLYDVLNDSIVYLYNNIITNLYQITYNGDNNIYNFNYSIESYDILINYLCLLKDQTNIIKDIYMQKQTELKTIIDYCVNEDEKIKKVYNTKSSLDIKLSNTDIMFN